MHPRITEMIAYLRSIGYVYTFDGNAVSDFIEKLDRVVDINNIEITGARLSLYITSLKEAKIEDLLSILPLATMLEVAAASLDKLPDGYRLWFEWILPQSIAKGETPIGQ
jgi:hypothetical protein